MTTHTDAASDPARLNPQSAKARRAAAGGRFMARVLNLRVTGMTPEAIAYSLKAPVEGVKACIRNARTLRDARALTDKAAAAVTATRLAVEAARARRTEAAATARARREARGRARDEAAAAAAAVEEARTPAVVVIDEVAPWPAEIEAPAAEPVSLSPVARTRRLEFVGPAEVPDPAALGPWGRQRFSRLLQAEAVKHCETSRAAAELLHLADLYAECPSFYPSVVIPSDGLTARRILPDLVSSPCGSAAALCVTHG